MSHTAPYIWHNGDGGGGGGDDDDDDSIELPSFGRDPNCIRNTDGRNCYTK
jgi:hypothetical protein